MNAQERFAKIRANLLLHQPFFGLLLTQVKIVRNDTFETMATNGLDIFYNEKFVEELNDNQLAAVFLHEILHCIYMHCDINRMGSRVPAIWNVAGDFVINLDIKDIGSPYNLPGGLLDEQFRGWSTEQVYNTILSDSKNCKCGGFGDILIMSPHDKIEEMEEKVLATHSLTKEQGTLPTGVSNLIADIRASKVRWETIFHRFIGQALANDDFSYGRPNKHYIPDDIYVPGLHSHIIGRVVVAVDSSGSVVGDKPALHQFIAELNKINHLVQEVTYISCDAKVHEVVRLNQFEDLLDRIKIEGGGGTSFIPVFDEVRRWGYPPELLIYLTDTQGEFPPHQPGYPVLWCTQTREAKVPWGCLVTIR